MWPLITPLGWPGRGNFRPQRQTNQGRYPNKDVTTATRQPGEKLHTKAPHNEGYQTETKPTTPSQPGKEPAQNQGWPGAAVVSDRPLNPSFRGGFALGPNPRRLVAVVALWSLRSLLGLAFPGANLSIRGKSWTPTPNQPGTIPEPRRTHRAKPSRKEPNPETNVGPGWRCFRGGLLTPLSGLEWLVGFLAGCLVAWASPQVGFLWGR